MKGRQKNVGGGEGGKGGIGIENMNRFYDLPYLSLSLCLSVHTIYDNTTK